MSRAREARARPFLSIIAVSVEIALTTIIPIIHSGSCSYVGGGSLQSETTGIIVLFSISRRFYICVCVCACYLY